LKWKVELRDGVWIATRPAGHRYRFGDLETARLFVLAEGGEPVCS